MISNNEIKEVKSLQQKKFRDETGLFVVEGEKMVAEALNSDFEVVKVYRREEIGDKVMERISGLSSPSPVLAVVKQKSVHSSAGIIFFGAPTPKKTNSSLRHEKDSVVSGEPKPSYQNSNGSDGALYLALDAIRDPGNLGTILRIADWFGVEAIFASRDTADVYNPKVVQASMGAIFRKPLIYCDLLELCEQAKTAGIEVFGTFLQGADIYSAELPARALVIMGNEANGISAEVAKVVDNRLTIPSFGGGAESLNVAIATAVTVSEFKRRWK